MLCAYVIHCISRLRKEISQHNVFIDIDKEIFITVLCIRISVSEMLTSRLFENNVKIVIPTVNLTEISNLYRFRNQDLI
jgi:hypothetical protein